MGGSRLRLTAKNDCPLIEIHNHPLKRLLCHAEKRPVRLKEYYNNSYQRDTRRETNSRSHGKPLGPLFANHVLSRELLASKLSYFF